MKYVVLFILFYSTSLLAQQDPFQNKEAINKVGQALSKTEYGKTGINNAKDFAKQNNLQYFEPAAALVTGKLRFRKENWTVTLGQDESVITYTWRLP